MLESGVTTSGLGPVSCVVFPSVAFGASPNRASLPAPTSRFVASPSGSSRSFAPAPLQAATVMAVNENAAAVPNTRCNKNAFIRPVYAVLIPRSSGLIPRPKPAYKGQAMLELRGITKRYDECEAVRGISLSILPNELHAVMGENGAGKSTLLQIAAGIVPASTGEIHWNGSLQNKWSIGSARAAKIGMVTQHFALIDGLSVLENIVLSNDGAPVPDLEAARRKAASAFTGKPSACSSGSRTSINKAPSACIARACSGVMMLIVLFISFHQDNHRP